MIESKLNNGVREVELDKTTPEDLVGCRYSLPIIDYVKCPKCNNVVPNTTEYEYVVTDVWTDEDGDIDERGEYTDKHEFTCLNCNKTYKWYDDSPLDTIWTDDLQDIPNIDDIVPHYMEVYNAVYKIYEENGEDDWFKAFDIYMQQKGGNDKVEENKEVKQESKLNLQEATIKALYDGLKDNTEIDDVEGLVDDVLVVTDPEITTDEYNEVIERAEEIIEDTPEGEIPLDPTYLGEYLQICPICGGSFIEDHILEPGTACPICYETPESFVMVGKLQAEEVVAEDNGLENEEVKDNEEVAEEEVMPEENVEEEQEEVIEPEETPVENVENSVEREERPRGARTRRNREVASKEIPQGNILTEKLEEKKDPEEDFEIDTELADTINGVHIGEITATYKPDTNTVVFFNAETGEDIDTIVYRNQTPEEIEEYMTSESGLGLKKENKTEVIHHKSSFNVKKESKEDKPVKVLCYGQVTEYPTRQEAINEFLAGMSSSEGSERDRYTNIYLDLLHTDKDFVYDYEDEYEDYMAKGDKEKQIQKKFDKEAVVDEYMTYVNAELSNGNERPLEFKEWLAQRNNKVEEAEENEEDDNKELLLGSNEDDTAEFTVEIATEEKIKELADKSAFTWEGMDTSKETLQRIVDDFKDNTAIELPVKFYIYDGKVMNDLYKLTDKNAYPDDLHFVSVDLDNWREMGNLPLYKLKVGARWLDDIVDNNLVRQQKIDGTDVDADDE